MKLKRCPFPPPLGSSVLGEVPVSHEVISRANLARLSPEKEGSVVPPFCCITISFSSPWPSTLLTHSLRSSGGEILSKWWLHRAERERGDGGESKDTGCTFCWGAKMVKWSLFNLCTPICWSSYSCHLSHVACTKLAQVLEWAWFSSPKIS